MSGVLVTGGAGFVGVPLVAELGRRGREVAVLDDFSGAGRERLGGLGPLADDVRVLAADLRDHDAVASAVASVRPAAIVHLAARHYIPWCEANPAETQAINVDGTANLLAAAAAAGVQRVLLASTGDVYVPSPAPHREDGPVAATSVYGASKLAAEQLLAGHAARHPGSDGRALRLFNVYGPGETNPHVLPEIIDQLRRGDVLRLGNTSPRRDWLYVEDAGRAIADLLDVPGSEPVNLAGGRAASVDELIAMIAEVTGRELRVERDPARMRPVDRPVLAADLTRLRTLLPDLEPTPLGEGLRRTLGQSV